MERYLDPILPLAKENNIRSAIGLGFVTACSVRGGPSSDLVKLMFKVAKELEVHLPFQTSEQEVKCVEKIAQSKGHVGNLHFDPDESRRARLLIADEIGFLKEDLYDTSTY